MSRSNYSPQNRGLYIINELPPSAVEVAVPSIRKKKNEPIEGDSFDSRSSSMTPPSTIDMNSISSNDNSLEPINSLSKSNQVNYDKWLNLYEDPTIKLIQPFIQDTQTISLDRLRVPVVDSKSIFRLNFESKAIDKEPYDENKYRQLQSFHINYDSRNYNNDQSLTITNLDLANPFHNIGDSAFLTRGVIMANIDAIFNLVPKEGGYMDPASPYPLIYCSLNDAPGGFSQYLQWRYPRSYGYGVSLAYNKGGKHWKLKNLNPISFNTDYGDSGAGNVVTNPEDVVKWILHKAKLSGTISIKRLNQGRKVDLVVTDQAFRSKKSNKFSIMTDESIVIAEILIALQILWPNGSMVIRIGNTTNKIYADLLHLLSAIFDYVTLFKPITSHPGNFEIYLIAIGYRYDNIAKRVIGILKEANSVQRSGESIDGLIEIETNVMADYLYNINNKAIDRQLLYYSIAKQLSDISDIEERKRMAHLVVPRFLNYYATVYWNIPS